MRQWPRSSSIAPRSGHLRTSPPLCTLASDMVSDLCCSPKNIQDGPFLLYSRVLCSPGVLIEGPVTSSPRWPIQCASLTPALRWPARAVGGTLRSLDAVEPSRTRTPIQPTSTTTARVSQSGVTSERVSPNRPRGVGRQRTCNSISPMCSLASRRSLLSFFSSFVI